jgi:5-methylcytosine-specific restriction enzyme A
LEASAIEGTPRLVTHLRRERNSGLAEKKKAATRKATGRLACEVCGFDFVIMYGTRGEGVCEVHHKTRLSGTENGTETSLDDLAVLCSNCHRVIHHADPMLSVEELSTVVKNGRLSI